MTEEILSVELTSESGVVVEVSGGVKKEPEVKKISLEELPFHELKRALKEKEKQEVLEHLLELIQ